MDYASEGIERGCGTREEGGLYLETGLAAVGLPLDAFLIDPPHPWDMDCKLGVQLVDRLTRVPDGAGGHVDKMVTHVLDYVGSGHYPFPADFVEEGRVHGFSRRLSKSLEVHRLSKFSRLLVVHGRGLVDPAVRATYHSCTDSRVASEGHVATWHGDAPPDRCARFCAESNPVHLWHPDGNPVVSALPGGFGGCAPGCTRDWYTDGVPTSADVPAYTEADVARGGGKRGKPTGPPSGVVSVPLHASAVSAWGAWEGVVRAIGDVTPEGGHDWPPLDAIKAGLRFYRDLPSGVRYRVHPPHGAAGYKPDGKVPAPQFNAAPGMVAAYAPAAYSALIASVPIGRLAVVDGDGAADTFESVASRVAKNADGLPVHIVQP